MPSFHLVLGDWDPREHEGKRDGGIWRRSASRTDGQGQETETHEGAEIAD